MVVVKWCENTQYGHDAVWLSGDWKKMEVRQLPKNGKKS